MPLQNPVAHVNHVDVLLHNYVARQGAVMDPVSQPVLVRRGARPGRPVNVPREIMPGPGHNIAKGARVNPFYLLHIRRSVAELESNLQAQSTLCPPSSVQDENATNRFHP